MKMPNTPFSTRLSGSAKETELRLRSIFQWKKKAPPVIMVQIAVLGVLICFGLVGFSSPDEVNAGVSAFVPDGVKPLAVAEVPGGVAYVTGQFRSADLYWMPQGGQKAVRVRGGIPRVDLSSVSLMYEDNGILSLNYIQLDWEGLDLATTIRYYVPIGGAPEYCSTIGGLAPK